MNSGEVEVLAYEALKLLPPNANVELLFSAYFIVTKKNLTLITEKSLEKQLFSMV